MSQSNEIKDLALALSNAQAEIIGAIKDSKNPFFKSSYADLESVWSAIRVPLTKNKLCVVQTTEVREGITGVVTLLAHSSGQWIQGFYPLSPVKNDPQAIGSAMTYARRYALAAIVGVAQIDDDGEGAMNRAKLPGGATAPNIKPEQPGDADGTPCDAGYKIDFGQWNRKTIEQIYRDLGPKAIADYIVYLEGEAKKKNQPIDPNGKVAIFINQAESFLGAMENQTGALS